MARKIKTAQETARDNDLTIRLVKKIGHHPATEVVKALKESWGLTVSEERVREILKG